ncbi:MAG: hypothetical protein RL113_84 [Pseudomonadota bacterium]
MNRKILIGASVILTQLLYAENTLLEEVDGHLRFGYQNGADGAEDIAIGGKLHLQTGEWQSISAGISIYTTNPIGSHDGAGMVFFDADHNAYSTLGEVYLKLNYGKNRLKVGRQEIDTPYADTDDNGMIPNRFEAAVFTNNDIDDLTITLAYLTKMAGVDAEVPETFTDRGMNEGIPAVGISYEGNQNVAMQGWVYNIKDRMGDRVFTYTDIVYNGSMEEYIAYEISGQYTTQEAFDGDATIYGISAALNMTPIGVTLSTAYNKVEGSAASNGFGGGPFFTSSEHLTLIEGGEDAKAVYLSVEFDAGRLGMEGLTLLGAYFNMDSAANTSAKETDWVANYAPNDQWSFDIFFSDIDDNINGDTYQNTRFFVNYMF